MTIWFSLELLLSGIFKINNSLCLASMAFFHATGRINILATSLCFGFSSFTSEESNQFLKI